MSRSRRYPSDLSDEEGALVEPLLPPVAQDGRPEAHPRRDIVDAILSVAHNGVVWRALPADFPPWETVYGFFSRWRKTGVTARLHDALRESFREVEGRGSQHLIAEVHPGGQEGRLHTRLTITTIRNCQPITPGNRTTTRGS